MKKTTSITAGQFTPEDAKNQVAEHLAEAAAEMSESATQPIPLDPQRQEFIGDAILEVMLRIIFSDFPPAIYTSCVAFFGRNKTLAYLAARKGIPPVAHDKPIWKIKTPSEVERHAAAFEIALYQKYLEEGFEPAKSWLQDLIETNWDQDQLPKMRWKTRP